MINFMLLFFLTSLLLNNGNSQLLDDLQERENDNEFPSDYPRDTDNNDGTTNKVTGLEKYVNSELKKPKCPDLCDCSVLPSDNGSDISVVDCSARLLTTFPENIDTTTNVLYLQNNHLEGIPNTILELKSLKVLDLSNNLISNIDTINDLGNLKELNIASNNLTEIPQILKSGMGLTKLEKIDVSGNDIKEIDVNSLSELKFLKQLYIPETTLDVLTNICNKLVSLEIIGDNFSFPSKQCSQITLPAQDESKLDNNEQNIIITPFDLTQETTTEIKAEVAEEDSSIPITPTEGNIEKSEDEMNDTLSEQTVTVTPSEDTIDTPPIQVENSSDVLINNSTESTDVSSNGEQISKNTNDDKPGDNSNHITLIGNENTIKDDSDSKKLHENVRALGGNLEESSRVNATSQVSIMTAHITSTDLEFNNTKANNVEVISENKDRSAQTGAINNTVIAGVIIVMIAIVAGVAITKNWRSIRNKFKPRPIPTHREPQTNGASPEETPLNEKSPV